MRIDFFCEMEMRDFCNVGMSLVQEMDQGIDLLMAKLRNVTQRRPLYGKR